MKMDIGSNATVADVATRLPATIRVFQQHDIDFCCGGRSSIASVCADRGIDVDALVAALHEAVSTGDSSVDWERASLADLAAHIQSSYHEPHRRELPRLGAMLAKVVSRHGDRHPETREVQAVFTRLHVDLLHHMQKEDAVLFPAIVAVESGTGGRDVKTWLAQPIDVMVDEHDAAGRQLAHMRHLTGGYDPPEGACPTYRGLYYGLAEFERDLQRHVHLENHVLFPRATALAQRS